MTSKWPHYSLEELEKQGLIELGRGNVISRKDILVNPGEYPIYSSAKDNEGKFGEYGSFMFDEEMITWSIDGGGKLFYRPKHKFSVTNVGGTLRIKNKELIDTRFLFFALSDLHSRHRFDWVAKAHPSVVRKVYSEIPIPPLEEQKRIVTKLADALDSLEQLKIAQIQKGIEARSLYDLEFERLMRRNEDNWPSISIGESCEYLNGKAHEPFVTGDGEYRLVTSKFVSTNGITARSVSKCLSPLNEGDVTFVLSDLPNGKALAKAYLVGKDEKLALNQRVMRIRSTKFVPEFLYLQINRHPELLSYDNGESQTHLKLKQILDCQLFCPEIELQKKVAKRLLSLKDLVNTHDQKVAIKLTEIESLKKRILRLAFSGDF